MDETTFIFEQHMSVSCDIIITRMKKIPYDGRWIFAKPKNLPKPTTRNTWKEFIRKLMLLTLNHFREVPFCDEITPVGTEMHTDILLTIEFY